MRRGMRDAAAAAAGRPRARARWVAGSPSARAFDGREWNKKAEARAQASTRAEATQEGNFAIPTAAARGRLRVSQLVVGREIGRAHV